MNLKNFHYYVNIRSVPKNLHNVLSLEQNTTLYVIGFIET